jgi:outer membrane immunogenic protein
MKHLFFIHLLCLCLIGNIAIAQQKKPTTKKPTTVKPAVPKATTPKTTTPTTTKPTTSSKPNTTTTQPSTAVEKKTTPVPSNSPSQRTAPTPPTPSSTTIQQSSGPSKVNRKDNETEEGEKVTEPQTKKVKTPKTSGEGGNIQFGVRAEVTQSYRLETGGGIDLSPAANLGLIINLPITSNISIQPEVLYSIISIKASTDENNSSKSSMGNILVPLMFNFNFGKSTSKFMLNLGGYGNYGLSQSLKVVTAGTTIKDGSIDLGNDRFDYGGGIGLGIKLNDKLMIEARSFYSMKDNINKTGFGTIGVGYFFK